MNFNNNNLSNLMTNPTITDYGTSLVTNTVPMDKMGVSSPNELNLMTIDDQALIESLERSVILETGKIDFSNNSEIRSIMTQAEIDNIDFRMPRVTTKNFPQALITASPFLKGKLDSIAYFKADVVVTVEVQCTPFQQGVLCLWAHPYEKQISDNAPQRTSLNEHLRSITCFPIAYLNLDSNSRKTEITIPYASEFQIINPRRKDNDLCAASLSIISSIDGASESESIGYVLSARMVNVSLYGRTNDDIDLVSATKWLVQEGEDESASRSGIISSVSNTIGSVADAVSDIPVLSTIAKPIGWVTKAVSGVASLFGLSKPVNVTSNVITSHVPARGLCNLEGVDASTMLAAEPANAIDPTISTFGSEDEMSISFIGKRRFVYGRAIWSTSDENGAVLGSIPIHPCPFATMGAYRGSSGTPGDSFRRTFFAPSSGYAASQFEYWRGNMVLNFSFAKTQFHSGRILVQYKPYGVGQKDGIETVFSTIIDLANVTPDGIDIECPFMAPNKWCLTFSGSEAGTVIRPSEVAGIVTATVLVPLLAPETVSQKVRMIVKAHWNRFELAAPGTDARIYNNPNTVDETPRVFASYDKTPLFVSLNANSDEAQAAFLALHGNRQNGVFDYELNQGSNVASPAGFFYLVDGALSGFPEYSTFTEIVVYPGLRHYNLEDVTPSKRFICQEGEDDMSPSQVSDSSSIKTTMGEMVVSLRALTRRFTNALKIYTNTLELHDQRFLHKLNDRQSVLEYISYMYRFNHGGLRYKIIVSDDKSTFLVSNGIRGDFDSPYGKFEEDNTSNAAHLQNTSLNNILEISVPFYSTATNIAMGSTQIPLHHAQVKEITSKPTRMEVWEAAGDDHTFTFLVGPPAFMRGPFSVTP